MSKNKLSKFADMETYPHVFQPAGSPTDPTPFPLCGRWGKDFFHNDNPIVLELGCGRGEYTVGLARLFPDKNFIGVDIDGDGQADYPLAWEDIDGDGKDEGGIDRDGDGHIDNVDGENVNHADPSSPAYGSVTDGNANNPGGGDVILIDMDGDGICETQLENPLPISTAIEFSAEIEEWEGTYDAVVDAQ